MHVIVGITGGIAAYKATNIIRLLTEAGHTVKVIPTQNALRFIGATTLEALSHNTVDADLYTDVESVKHVSLGQEADLVIVAPASAAFLGRFAAGIADDLLGNTLLVTKAPIVLAPAMHSEMWQNLATSENVSTLAKRGVHILEPAVGRLTGEDSGIGRLPEPEQIVEFALSKIARQDLAGKRFLITAGGTREEIDPVRFIGNKSSGKQGISIALEAVARGASVTLIAANIDAIPAELKNIEIVQNAKQLNEKLNEHLANHDVLVMAAAIADFRVLNPSTSKLKRSELGDHLQLELVANEDILANAVQRIQSENLSVLSVGFAAETASGSQQLEDLAKHKLENKGCDMIVANNVSNGAVFDSETNDVLILTKSGRSLAAHGSKRLVAAELLDVIADLQSK
jgi:phosphopantothenoylcysteine decarboxylase/phosphopantothenate--cysteine ligase